MHEVLAADAHKKSITWALMGLEGPIEGPKKIPATPDDVTGLGERFPTHTFVFEACGVQEWMLDVLREKDVDARAVVPPKKARKGSKSDKRDLVRLGRLFLAGELNEVYVPPPELRAIHDLVRHHDFFTRKRTSFNNRLRHEMSRYNIHPEPVEEGGDAPGPYTRAARAQIEPQLPLTGQLYDMIWTLDAQLRELDRRLDSECKRLPEARLLRSIPGWGAKTALAFTIETGPVDRFPTAAHVSSYYGLEPVKWQSGEAERDLHRISKKGCSYMRGSLVQAAWRHVWSCPDSDMSAWFAKRTADGMHRKEAIVGVARRLTEAAYAMLRDDRKFTLTGPARLTPCRPRAAHA